MSSLIDSRRIVEFSVCSIFECRQDSGQWQHTSSLHVEMGTRSPNFLFLGRTERLKEGGRKEGREQTFLKGRIVQGFRDYLPETRQRPKLSSACAVLDSQDLLSSSTTVKKYLNRNKSKSFLVFFLNYGYSVNV